VVTHVEIFLIRLLQPIQLLLNQALADVVSDVHHESLGSYVMFYSADFAAKLRALSKEENTVRIHVERHGTQGVWSRDLRRLSGLSHALFNKALKVLEGRNFIKNFKTVANKSKKMYITFDRDPSPEMTGGPWYSNGEFDSDFAAIIETLIMHQIAEQPRTVAELLHLCAAVSDVLTHDIVQSVVDTLIYDGRVREEPATGGAAARYGAAAQHLDLGVVPCDSCKFFNECSADNPKINPSTCQPFRNWFVLSNEASSLSARARAPAATTMDADDAE
jgi:DNA-directed RNA polymerase III subunit RPC6